MNGNEQFKFAVVNAFPATGKYGFSIFHETEEIAKEEAKRLCEKERKTFLVLKVVGEARIPSIPVEYKAIA